MAEKTINVDIVDKSVAPLNHINIAIVNEPNPVKGLDVTGKQLLQLIRIQNYWITNTADGKQVTGDNIFDYFPELNPWGGGGSGGPTSADKVSYDNSTSGLTGDDVQEAIDELAEGGGVGKATTSGGEIFNDYENNVADAQYAHAEGENNIASGEGAHAEGLGTTASGEGAHAEGTDGTASGDFSHAEGNRTRAIGESSHAEGFSATAMGESSHAEGANAKARMYCSHAEGHYTDAASEYQHVQGKYNVTDSKNKYAFIIGNGTDNKQRSNAFAIDWDGKIYVNNSNTGIDVSTLLGRVASAISGNIAVFDSNGGIVDSGIPAEVAPQPQMFVTLTEYNALTEEEKMNGTIYNIIEETLVTSVPDMSSIVTIPNEQYATDAYDTEEFKEVTPVTDEPEIYTTEEPSPVIEETPDESGEINNED